MRAVFAASNPWKTTCSFESRELSCEISVREVLEVDVADSRGLIPLKHGIDGLAQLGAAFLVDTAGIYPSVSDPLKSCLFASEPDLVKSCLCVTLCIVVVVEVRERDLVRAPGVGENGVARGLSQKVFEGESLCVYEPHRDSRASSLGAKRLRMDRMWAKRGLEVNVE